MKIELYSDGSCLGNPGPGGYASVLIALDDNGNLLKEPKIVTGGVDITTNNAMEICAVTAGLQALTAPTKLTIYTDSNYVIGSMTKHWKRKANQLLWMQLDAVSAMHTIEWVHVDGHSGNKYNELADKLARREAERIRDGL